ncbi:TetR/AcrR family transcriptional regulator [Nonomuraea sp. NPDC049480]|uniref:TetR/AcrR family transcriptional regulator n=1 Tax=Nonomuraea sp. NPDC049480 TaxID=3364353 RepID=UPI0037B13B04
MITAKRPRDSAATRQAILSAAARSFAEHGFDGARIDMIAEASGCNKALIFRYFEDKLGLYVEVLQRMDREVAELIAQALPPPGDLRSLAANPQRLATLLRSVLGALVDHMLADPQTARMLCWEQAEGWETYAKIIHRFDTDDLARLTAILDAAREEGTVRADLDISLIAVILMQVCWSIPSALALREQLSGTSTHPDHAREQIVAFLIAAIVQHPQENQ